MQFLASAHALFAEKRQATGLHEALTVSREREEKLVEARNLIRDAIRRSAGRIRAEDMFWNPISSEHRTYRLRPDVTPKFFMQGMATNFSCGPRSGQKVGWRA